ncbi:MAG: fructokinase [endosymbiont of Galathealinum brachiosum]|uniref:Fructokinase n=1 Tax=endosymbiont of Galathealinum brachiosum TaxID=2200906 RepID=A0A370D9L6_9GAMM|nr:MAG: fructokinase [endosymbiont of Galathealinum brachiosum]
MRIGIDLGGTKVEGIALDDNGKQLIRHRVLTPAGDYQGTLNAIVDLVGYIESSIKHCASIGIGTPGSLSPVNQLLRNSNSVCMNGQPVKQDLEKLLNREIRMSNDANCFALSEATDGAAKGENIVFGVIVGTGTGAGIVVNGKVLTGANAIAGEWGHNPLPWPESNELPGSECYCGKYGCIETFLSGPGLSADYFSSTGEQLDAVDVVALSKADSQAEVCLLRYEDRMARGLAHIINVLDPDVIVLGGGMSNVSRLYKNVPELWGQYVFSDVVNTRLLAPVYGDSSGVRGAAWLWD